MTPFQSLHMRVLAATRMGHTLDEIDERIIEPSSLPAEEKAALWIIARDELVGVQRYALSHIGSRGRVPVPGTE